MSTNDTPTDDQHHDAEQPEPAGAQTEPDAAAAPPESASPEAYTRVCRRCSAQATTAAEACPACGRRYVRRRPSRRLTVVALLALLIVGGGAGANAYLDHRAEVKREQERVARERAAERRAAEERRQKEKEQQEIDKVVSSFHETMVLELRKAITKDAQQKSDDGLLEDRATGTQCDNTDGNEDDPDADLAEYECLAITDHNGDGTVGGYRYTARINYEDGSYTWKLGD